MGAVNRLFALAVLFVGFSGLLFAPDAYASKHLPLDIICQNTPEATACQNRNQTVDSNDFYGRNGILTKVIRILSVIVGVVSVFVMIISGVKYMTSNGEPNRVNSAKDSLLYAVIGLALVALSQSIVIFVLNKL